MVTKANRKKSTNVRAARPAPRGKKTKNNPETPANRSVTQSAAEEAAYYSWLNRGCPLWDDWSDWFKAEYELQNNQV